MKYCLIILISLISSFGNGQTINPALGTVSNKSYSPAQAIPTDFRSMYWDNVNFVARDYASKTEVVTYLNLNKYRTGHFPVYIHQGGTLTGGGIWIGGTTDIYIFKDSTDINSLVYWNTVQSVNGQQGVVITKNADSIRGKAVDTTVASGSKNNYLLTYDSTNNKWKLTAPASSYTAGTGIDVTGNVISALNTSALWNAIQLRSRSISTTPPSVGQSYVWDGVAWSPSSLNGLDTAYLSNDTLYLVNTFDTIPVVIKTIYNADDTLQDNRIVHTEDFNLEFNGKNSNINLVTDNDDKYITVTPTGINIIYGANSDSKGILIDNNPATVITDGIDSIGIVGRNLSTTKILANDTAYTRVREVRQIVGDSVNAVTNASESGDTLVISNTIKRLNAGYGIINTPSSTNITQRLDSATVFPQIRATVANSNTYILNQSSAVQNATFAISGTAKIGTTLSTDSRVKLVLKDNQTSNGLASVIFKNAADNNDVNMEGAGMVYHDSNYYATPGYARILQVYSLAGAYGTAIGNNNFVGVDSPYAPLDTDIPNGYIRFELGPVWPESEKMRLNNRGDLIVGWQQGVNYIASQTGQTVTETGFFDFSPSDVGKFFRWGDRLLEGRHSECDRIIGYIDEHNIIVETSREIPSQGGQVVAPRALIDTAGNGNFPDVRINGTSIRTVIDNAIDSSESVLNNIVFLSRTSTGDNQWRGITYGNGLFVAVSLDGTNRVMTSPDGINWTGRSAATANAWDDVCYGNGLFVAVARSGTGNRVMTSPDGINWTAQTTPVDNNWNKVTYGNGLFVAVAYSGSGDRVMTSPDGITWTSRTSAADNTWTGLTYGNGLFVAVSEDGTNRVMTSPDGITWTSRNAAQNNSWSDLVYANGLFVTVANSGTNRVMTSPDGITWTSRNAATNNDWISVTYGDGLFVATAISGNDNRVMTSPDGINWTIRSSPADNEWFSVTYGNGVFAAVSASGSGNRCMSYGRQLKVNSADNNIYQGGLYVNNKIGVNTNLPDSTLHIVGSLHTTAGVRHDNLPDGSGSDSVLVTNNGTVKKVLQSSIGASYTFSTGLTNTSGTVTNDVVTGKAGGNTWSGGTNANDGLTIQSTTDATKGNIVIGTTGAQAYITMRGWQVRDIQETNSTSLTLGAAYTYVSTNTGSTTWTLPIILTDIPIGVVYNIKNAGTNNITLNRGGSNTIYNTSSVTSITILPGENYKLHAGNGVWYVL